MAFNFTHASQKRLCGLFLFYMCSRDQFYQTTWCAFLQTCPWVVAPLEWSRRHRRSVFIDNVSKQPNEKDWKRACIDHCQNVTVCALTLHLFLLLLFVSKSLFGSARNRRTCPRHCSTRHWPLAARCVVVRPKLKCNAGINGSIMLFIVTMPMAVRCSIMPSTHIPPPPLLAE